MAIQVVVRPHPDSSHLSLDHNTQEVTILLPQRLKKNNNTITNDDYDNGKEEDVHMSKKIYPVSVALAPPTTQTELFQAILQPMLDSWLAQGQSGAMFAYGFTGTYTFFF